jgi:hypothetical protein
MNSVPFHILDRLRQIALERGSEVLENAIKLKTAPDLKAWAWYARLYQEFHTAFLLLVEIFQFPMRKQADHIWHCLDYVYETNTTPDGLVLSQQDIIRDQHRKARFILGNLVHRIAAYHKKRKIRIPVSMKESMILITPRRVGNVSDPTLPLNYAHMDDMAHFPVEEVKILKGHTDGIAPSSSSNSYTHHIAIHRPPAVDQTTFKLTVETIEKNQILPTACNWQTNYTLDDLTPEELRPGSLHVPGIVITDNNFIAEQHANSLSNNVHTGIPGTGRSYSQSDDERMINIDWVRFNIIDATLSYISNETLTCTRVSGTRYSPRISTMEVWTSVLNLFMATRQR